jgi:hypothetical protein
LQVQRKKELVYVGVEDAFLLEIMGHGVLGEKWRLEPDFSADPFALAVWGVGRMIAASATAELRAEVGALDLLELLDLLPGRVTHGAGDIDLQVQDAHNLEPEVSKRPEPNGEGSRVQ